MRDAWLPLGLVVLVGAAAPLACGQAFELTGGSTGSSAGTGGGSSTTSAGSSGASSASAGGHESTSTSTSTGSVGTLCTVPADCGGATTLCGLVLCTSGHCKIQALQPDGPSFSQLYGDCHTAKCSTATLKEEPNSSDVYDDGNPCTTDTCENGVPKSTINVGAQCGTNGICNAKGACVECVGNGTCDGGKPMCINNYCSAQTCQDSLLDGKETDVDCGGDDCGPCDASLLCKLPSDCKSKVCDYSFMGAPFKQCLIANCTDNVQNGGETDVDCGGLGCPATSKCDPGQHCAVHTDCKSGVCQAGLCQKESCTDGVKNGIETGIDCGAPGCVLAKCPGG